MVSFYSHTRQSTFVELKLRSDTHTGCLWRCSTRWSVVKGIRFKVKLLNAWTAVSMQIHCHTETTNTQFYTATSIPNVRPPSTAKPGHHEGQGIFTKTRSMERKPLNGICPHPALYTGSWTRSTLLGAYHFRGTVSIATAAERGHMAQNCTYTQVLVYTSRMV